MKRRLNSYSYKNLGSNLYFLLSRSLTMILIIPVLTFKLTPEEMTEWFVYFSIFVVIQIFDSGLVSVATRILKYDPESLSRTLNRYDFDTRSQIQFSYLRKPTRLLMAAYGLLSIFGGLSVFTTYMVLSYFGNSPDAIESYAPKIGIMSALAGLSLFSNQYIVRMNAAGRYSIVQLVRGTTQWLLLFSILVLLYAEIDIFFCALFYHGVNALSLAALGVYVKLKVPSYDEEISHSLYSLVKSELYTSVKKTFLGLLLIIGMQQLTGVYISENYSPEISASYFIFLQILRSGNTIGRSPLYSQLPNLYTLVHKDAAQTRLSLFRGMIFGITFYLVFATLAPLGLVLLSWLGFLGEYEVSALYWLLGIFLLLELIGGLMAESLTVWGIIIWSKAAFATLAVFALLFPFLEHQHGITGISVSLILSYVLGFYPILIMAVVRAKDSIFGKDS